VAAYIPKKGDFVALTFDPQTGHEQRGRRPALIVSNDIFNRHTGMAIACPITSTDRRYPFHVAVGEGLACYGVRHGGSGKVHGLPRPSCQTNRESSRRSTKRRTRNGVRS